MDTTITADRSRMGRPLALQCLLLLMGAIWGLIGLSIPIVWLRWLDLAFAAVICLFGIWQIATVANIFGLRLNLGESQLSLKTTLGSTDIPWQQVHSVEVKERQGRYSYDRPEVLVTVNLKGEDPGSITVPGYVFSLADERALLGYLLRRASARGLRMTTSSRQRKVP